MRYIITGAIWITGAARCGPSQPTESAKKNQTPTQAPSDLEEDPNQKTEDIENIDDKEEPKKKNPKKRKASNLNEEVKTPPKKKNKVNKPENEDFKKTESNLLHDGASHPDFHDEEDEKAAEEVEVKTPHGDEQDSYDLNGNDDNFTIISSPSRTKPGSSESSNSKKSGFIFFTLKLPPLHKEADIAQSVLSSDKASRHNPCLKACLREEKPRKAGDYTTTINTKGVALAKYLVIEPNEDISIYEIPTSLYIRYFSKNDSTPDNPILTLFLIQKNREGEVLVRNEFKISLQPASD